MSHDPSESNSTAPQPDSHKAVAPSGNGSSALWFLVGGMVVALGVLFFIVMGDPAGDTQSPSGDVSVTIEGDTTPPADDAEPAEGGADAEAPAEEGN